MVHFGPDRLAQVVAHYASFTDFPRAMGLVMERETARPPTRDCRAARQGR